MEKLEEYYKLIAMKPIVLKGDFLTKMAWLNDKEIIPEHSRKIFNHTTKGFDWGNTNEGSAQLALAILLELTNNKKISMILHHIFKNEFLASLPQSDFQITIDIGDWFFRNITRSGMLLD